MWKKHQNQKEERLEENNPARVLFLFIFLFQIGVSFAETVFYYTPKILDAQKQNLELRLIPARDSLIQEKNLHPNNAAIDFAMHFNYWMEAFITEEESKYKRYKSFKEDALTQLQMLPDSVAYKKYAIAEVHFYSAMLKAKFNELYSAAREVSKANSLIEENHKLFPGFIQNNKTRGIIKVYLSTVPDNYTWVINLLGIEGDLNDGLRMLKNLAHVDSDNKELKLIAKETGYIYSFALFHVAKQHSKAWAETLWFTKDYRTNSMSVFFRSNMALKMNKNESAIKVLQLRPKGNEYYPFYFLDYQHGVAKLNRQDIDAIEYLRLYQEKFKGRNYIKSCSQKMSWYYLLAGDYDQYNYHKKQVLSEGVQINEDDKQAQNYSSKPQPNRRLLKARLLYDGGYYKQALEVISKLSTKSFKTRNEKAEYCYRKGRVFEKLGKEEVAIKFYNACGLLAKNSTEYYGPYACLYMADYYLKNNEKELAKKYYEKALTFKKNKEYKDSIEQRAKSGLKKV
jgi:hypothetical protein